MSEKDKAKVNQPKNIPKDSQVITAIMKEMGITEYEPKTIVQLTEFVYKYGTSILEEARTYANNSKKKIDLDDVRLALLLSTESMFTMPPSREVLLECSRNKNHSPLPLIKPHCGLRLPPDRHCLSSTNYILKGNQKKHKINFTIANASPPMKVATKQNINFIKRTNAIGINKQTVTIPKPITKISTNVGGMQPQKTVLKPKIQITQNINVTNLESPMDIDSGNGGKRKRIDDDLDQM
ncbi:transcription initiation factor TFIID subunit 9 [Onthophagus taurus]|uniref:transcription initiation factor TFIID subunit 9 n=1 Tax=Onthophagus taurus TaxID=166361 RepID=UPI000C200A7D|nr:transcription initiation factor TFIID subunit 9 [Onthophagus taurus]